MNKKSLLTLVGLLAINGSVLAQSFTMSHNNITVAQAMAELKQKTGYAFLYESSDLNTTRRVSVNAKNLNEAVSQIVKGQDVDYEIQGHNIVISKKQQNRHKVSQGSTKRSEGNRVVRGTITDQNGDPVIGATIQLKGNSSIGTVSDLDGHFTLDVPAGTELVVSYIGYSTQTIKTNGQSDLRVNMKEDNKNLSEVVVVGYGTQKKANLTGAVASVSVDDMEGRPITNSSTLLQGTASGVYALQKSGQPGADGAVVNIRGVGTLNNSAPLVIIDGFPGSMDDVDASEIASISVLKDAASSSIYGNRAANGVILITTKRGAAGTPTVTYSGYYGVQQATRLPHVLDSYQYTTLYNEACQNMGMSNKYSDDVIAKYKAGNDPMYPSNNYFDIYYKDANMSNHRINVSGGSDNFQYAVMMGYLDQDGILVETNYRKADFRANLDSWFLNRTLRFTTRLSGNTGKQKQPTDLWSTIWYSTLAPIFPMKTTDGQWAAVNGERNYYGEAKEGSTTWNKTDNFNGQIEGEYKFLNGFSLQLTYGYNVEHGDKNAFNANVVLISATA